MDSTQLIAAADADYKMLKEKGKEGESVLHYNGYLDGYARGFNEGKDYACKYHRFAKSLSNKQLQETLAQYPDDAIVAVECCDVRKLVYNPKDNTIRID